MSIENISRTAGPFNPDETGPVAGDIVISKGNAVYTGGTFPKRAEMDIRLDPPLDKGEVGTAYNGYDIKS
jgi:hypothetical protein